MTRRPSNDTRIYTATIQGTWNPGGIAALDSTTFPHVQDAAIDATRRLLGVYDDEIGFHLVFKVNPDGPVHRSRWRLQATATGPALHVGTRDEHDSEIALSMQVDSFAQHLQVVTDEDMPEMPYRGTLSGVVPALLLRHYWGPGARHITINGIGTGVFTPHQLTYAVDRGLNAAAVPYDTDHLADYAFAERAGSAVQPAVWLVTDDLSTAWKVSCCVPDLESARSDQWDDPAQPAPDFTPLDWPARERVFVWPANTRSAARVLAGPHEDQQQRGGQAVREEGER